MLCRHARCFFSRLRYNEHSLLSNSYLFRIGKIESPSCSACCHPIQDTSYLILHYPAMDSLRCSLFVNSFLSVISGPDLGKFPVLWGSMVCRNAPSLERGRVTTKKQPEIHSSKYVHNYLLCFAIINKKHHS